MPRTLYTTWILHTFGKERTETTLFNCSVSDVEKLASRRQPTFRRQPMFRQQPTFRRNVINAMDPFCDFVLKG